jgi:hypothetical protein
MWDRMFPFFPLRMKRTWYLIISRRYIRCQLSRKKASFMRSLPIHQCPSILISRLLPLRLLQSVDSNHNCDLRSLKRKETRGAGDDMKLPFSCSSEFHGDLTNLSFLNCSSGSSAVGLRLFEHANLTNSLCRCDDDNHGIFTPPSGNSLYFGTWATVQYATLDGAGYSSYDPGYSYDPDNLAHESEIVHPYISVDSWILACSTTAYRVDYQWVNGGVGAATVQEDYSLGLLVGYQWTDACSQPDLANITRTIATAKTRKT